MRKTIVVVLSLALTVGAIAAPAGAKKKKPKTPPATGPVQADQTFYLRNETTGCTSDALQLSVVSGTDTANCGSTWAGPANEVVVRAFGDVCPASIPANPATRFCPITYTAVDGLPFVLDATKEIKGLLGVSMWCCGGTPQPVGNGVGPITVTVRVKGIIGGEEKLIGATDVTFTALPNQRVYEVEYTIKPDAALDKATVEGLQFSAFNRGASPMTGHYTTEAPDSAFTIGIWK